MGRGRVVAGVLLAWLAASSCASLASAAPPCWKTLLNDWYDGRIDGAYPVHCYTDAVNHLPKDLQAYRQVRSDITRTLQDGIVAMSHNGHSLGPNNVVPGSVPPSHGSTAGSTLRLALAGVLIFMLTVWTIAAYRRRFGRSN